MNDTFLLALSYCLLFALLLTGLELLVRHAQLSATITRRIAHVAAGLFSLVMWSTFTPTIFLICCSALIALICVSYFKRLLTSVHSVSRHTYGEIALPVGILITYLLAANQPDIFIPSMLLLTFADACAGIVADLRGNQRSSRLGSVVFFIVALFFLLPYVQSFSLAVSIGFIMMVVEKISQYGTDNATIPVVTAVLLLL